jgi:hypothetical protein
MKEANELPSEPIYGTEAAIGQPKNSATPTSNLYDPTLGAILRDWEAGLRLAEGDQKALWEQLERQAPVVKEFRGRAIRGLVRDNLAKESYCNLLRAGLQQPKFLQVLVGMAVLTPRRGKAPKWLSALGMTPKQIDYLPRRLNALADEIERLNKYPLLRPDLWVRTRRTSQPQSKVVVDYLENRLMRLPCDLRLYAAFIDSHTKSFSRCLREKSRTSPRVQVLAVLISLVRRETGRPMFRDLSLILSAAARASGLADSDWSFDEPTLKVLDSRMQKKQKDFPSP